ncbi:S8 family serine peptidase [Allokutzneria sp. A3M-2-11 16]|uniref:S8 family peptidase n=1 Tax=Allokutzneria sp. A3M-2-11 16 TaxID=2962043 RepID=UPI0020B8943A|nr:S8 family serine peptidase [Allokutzneria sp. A3M-2-11 16]MCP3800834.1 S8 family serine peptidase [Allokutzneria sp. A3M-2-11 16]
MHRRTLPGAITVAALVAVGLGVPAQAAPKPTTTAPEGRAVTLITGDRVHLDATGVPVHTEAAPNRTGTRFHTSTRNGHHYVIPEDAKAPLESGRLDRRLFDITLLVKFGYEDSKVDEIPLLLSQGAARSAPAVPDGSRRTGQVSALGITSVRTAKANATATWERLRGPSGARSLTGADRVWLNGKMSYSLDRSVPLTGAPAAWQAGHTAKDVTVAVLDSGIDTKHPDLAGVVAKDFSGSQHGVQDVQGHGTHVTSTVAGTGAASGGKYAGMTKGAKVLMGKVGDYDVSDEAALGAMAWASVENKAKVVNMSFGGGPEEQGPIYEGIERLTEEQGTLFVVAAGNDGKDGSVGSPATADAALAVASSTKQKELSSFSSRGPRHWDHAVKPDITGPGSEIIAARAAGTSGVGGVPEQYTVMSGTSMAAPHLTGAAAIIAGQHPDWSPGRIKATLMSTANPIDGTSVYGQGTGLVDLARATSQRFTAEEGSLSLGLFTWPHTGQRPATNDVTYRNDGDKPLTAKLDLSIVDKDGKPADSVQFRLSTNEITVPAKGSAKVSVTVDPTRRVGLYGGRLTATAGTDVVRTAIGAHVEDTMHVMSFKATGRDGKPAEPTVTVVGLDKETQLTETVELDANGTGKLRLPAGDYMVTSELYEHGPRGAYASDPLALINQVAPKITLSADRTLDIDARTAKPMRVELDDPEMKVVRQSLSLLHAKGSDAQPCCTPQRASTYVDTDTPVLVGSLGGNAKGFRHINHVTAVRPEVISEIVAPQRLPLSLTRDANSPRLVGEHRMDVVDGKTGGDLKGKLVLLDLDPKTGDTAKAVKAAADAGAKAVLVVQPARGLFSPTPIPVFKAAEHRLAKLTELLKAGPVAVRVLGAKDNPISYDVALTASGGMPDGGEHRIRKDDLVKIDARYHRDGRNFGVRPQLLPGLDGPNAAVVPVSFPFREPAPLVELGTTRTEYVSPGWWEHELGLAATPTSGFPANNRMEVAHPTKFGAPRRMEFNSGPFGPAVARNSMARLGNEFVASPTLFGPRGWSTTLDKIGEATLRRDGKVVATSTGRALHTLLPADRGRYELRVRSTRDAKPGALGTSADLTWGFTSSGTGQDYTPIPVLVLEPKLPLDIGNAVPANTPQPIEITASAKRITEMRLSVSYDEGSTWVEVPVRQSGERWQGTLPAGGKAGGYGSLRMEAKDRDGNTVKQTVLRTHSLG